MIVWATRREMDAAHTGANRCAGGKGARSMGSDASLQTQSSRSYFRCYSGNIRQADRVRTQLINQLHKGFHDYVGWRASQNLYTPRTLLLTDENACMRHLRTSCADLRVKIGGAKAFHVQYTVISSCRPLLEVWMLPGVVLLKDSSAPKELAPRSSGSVSPRLICEKRLAVPKSSCKVARAAASVL